ncbi:hypothetical protein MRB53_039135 [Persea americana]|nr:hypothetical protein MRB53_039135 [Persea americana]
MDEKLPGTVRIYDADVSSTTSDAPLLVPCPSDSPSDPLNWSVASKVWHATLVCSVTGLTAAIANDAAAAADQQNEELGISYDIINDAAGVLFLGIALGSYFLYPSTVLYGRRIQYLISLVFAILGSIWFASAKTSGDNIGSQLFCGIAESCAEALVQLSLTDIFFVHQRGSAIALYVLATSIGTFLGPLLAGLIETGQGTWRWIGWWGAIASGILFILFTFGLQESFYDRDAMGNAQLTGGEDHDFKERKSDQKDSRRKHYLSTIRPITRAPQVRGTGFRQYLKLLLSFPLVFAFPAVIYSGIQWGSQDAWLTFYLTTEDTTYYDPPYNYTDKAVALMNVPSLIGAIIGCLYAGPLSDWWCLYCARRRHGLREAEDRLWFFILPGILSPLGMLLFGIGSDRGWYWPGPYVGLGLIGFGWGSCGDLAISYLIDAYPDIVLESLVGVAVINNLIGMVGAFVTGSWIDSAGVAGSYIAIAVLEVVIIIGTTIFMIFCGKRLRRWSAPRYESYLQIKSS